MKKILLILGLYAFCSNTVFSQQKGKVSSPEFQTTKIEMKCCTNKRLIASKVVHVEYNHAPVGMKMRIEDNVGNLIGDYIVTGGDYTTPCLALANGSSYKVRWVDNAGVLYGFSPTTLIAPTCGIRKEVEIDRAATPILKN